MVKAILTCRINPQAFARLAVKPGYVVNEMTFICEKCNNYKISPGGCNSLCFENISEPFYLTEFYFENRENGIAKNCKAFKPLPALNTHDAKTK